MGHMCNAVKIFVQGYMAVMWNACISMLLVTFLIAMSLYKVYIPTKLSHICT